MKKTIYPTFALIFSLAGFLAVFALARRLFQPSHLRNHQVPTPLRAILCRTENVPVATLPMKHN